MQKYRYKTIKEIYDENISKINNGETISKFDELIGISAGYAVDFSDIARNAGTSRVRLDFTFDTETNIDKAVLPVHFYNRAHGMSEEDCIKDLHKKIAAYELFALTNYMNDAGAEAEIIYDPKISENLIIKAESEQSNGTVYFDSYEALGRVLDKALFYTDEKIGDDRGLMVGLFHFQRIVNNEFFTKLFPNIG